MVSSSIISAGVLVAWGLYAISVSIQRVAVELQHANLLRKEEALQAKVDTAPQK